MPYRLLPFSLCALLGLFTPLQHQAVALCVLLLAHAGCSGRWRAQLQLVLGAAIGGLCAGAGAQLAVGLRVHYGYAPAIVVPLLFWLAARMLFLAVQRRSGSAPAAGESPAGAAPTATNAADPPSAQGPVQPGADGRLRWEFFDRGEIAMGGPVYGDLVFSNRSAFAGVAPDVVVSDDDRYAALVLPARDRYGFLLVDFQHRCAYEIEGTGAWEVERIEHGTLLGRHTVHRSKLHVGIASVTHGARTIPLVEDDGWWLLDDPQRAPLPRHVPVEIANASGRHRVRFEPDASRHARNPLERLDTPEYGVSVDGVALDFTVRAPKAVWMHGPGHADAQRYVWIGTHVHDVATRRTRALGELDSLTHVFLGEPLATADAVVVTAIAMPRSTSFSDAEYEISSTTFPFDEDEATVYDAEGRATQQRRDRVQRHFRYAIDVPRFIDTGELHRATHVELLNRARLTHRAQWVHEARAPFAGYSRYRAVLSCGVDPGAVTHEAIWSHCGRYLAVLLHAEPPAVPDRIRIVDFDSATVRDVPGRHALASFIWFDEHLLELTRVVGVRESLTLGPGRSEQKTIRLDADPALAAAPFDLLVGGLDERRAQLDTSARVRAASGRWALASVNLVAQHCILYAPLFDPPVPQPPAQSRAT